MPTPRHQPAPAPALVRAIDRWSLAALVLNSTIGTGVFILPGTVAGALGWLSIVAWMLAAACTAAIVLCFAEVASRFSSAGGAYLYAQAAFGRFVGIQIGWLSYVVRCITAAVQANLFTVYLAELWPGAASRPAEIAVTSAFIGVHAAVNLRSVALGARVSNALAVVKIVPLIAFAGLGFVWIASGRGAPAAIAVDPTLGGWLSALLLLMFAYGGFESALIPLAEVKNPRRDAPFALLAGLATVTVVYLAAQITVLATLADPDSTSRPIAASARVMAGAGGAVVVSLAALISVYGWLASNMLNVPRLTMAMADRGDLPSFFGRIHHAFRTPWVSILIFATLAWLFALQGLLQNLSLSAVSRLFVYGLVCAALPVFRSRDARAGGGGVGPALFRAPGGIALAAASIALSLVLASRMTMREAVSLAVVASIATAHWGYLRMVRSARG